MALANSWSRNLRISNHQPRQCACILFGMSAGVGFSLPNSRRECDPESIVAPSDASGDATNACRILRTRGDMGRRRLLAAAARLAALSFFRTGALLTVDFFFAGAAAFVAAGWKPGILLQRTGSTVTSMD